MSHVLRAPAVFTVLFTVTLFFPTQSAGKKYREKSQIVPLSQVVAATKFALNDYQTYALSYEGAKGKIPPLATADFDFKTVVDNKGGVSINLFVFTLGATHDKQQTSDLDFQYLPQVQPPADVFAYDGGNAPQTLYQQIIDTLKESAKEIQKASERPQTDSLNFRQLTLALSFGVTTDIQGRCKNPLSDDNCERDSGPQ
jgi:hypothetical protein